MITIDKTVLQCWQIFMDHTRIFFATIWNYPFWILQTHLRKKSNKSKLNTATFAYCLCIIKTLIKRYTNCNCAWHLIYLGILGIIINNHFEKTLFVFCRPHNTSSSHISKTSCTHICLTYIHTTICYNYFWLWKSDSTQSNTKLKCNFSLLSTWYWKRWTDNDRRHGWMHHYWLWSAESPEK